MNTTINGIREGLWKFETEFFESLGYYRNGIQDGCWKRHWKETGKLDSVTYYDNVKKTRLWKEYSFEEKLETRILYL